MRNKDLVIFSSIFLLCVIVTSEIVTYQLTGNHLIGNYVTPLFQSKEVTCTNDPVKSRPTTKDHQLKVISEYEKACGSAFLSDMMLFTNMPISTPDAVAAADKMSARLKEFSQQDISPIVIAEPDSEWGLVDFHEFATGYYDAWVKSYFERLKQNGITDSMMGLWIPFPEPQQPYWNNNGDPDDFSASVNRYFKSLRQYFPQGKTGILLDSQAGETDKAPQLLAYTRLVDNSLVDVAGLQGFPWYPADATSNRSPITSASEFAPASLLDQVAKSLGTKEVLLNIGTYRHKKAEEGGDIAVTTVDRQASLDSIVHEVSILKNEGYKTTVNIFAENKFGNKEGVDWSYWQPGKYKDSEQTSLFTHFVSSIKNGGSDVSLYDSRN